MKEHAHPAQALAWEKSRVEGELDGDHRVTDASVLRGGPGRRPPRHRAGRSRGKQLARARITDDAAGFAQFTALLTEHGDSEDAPIPVAIETSRGLLVACPRATGRPVFAINPLAVARYRDRHFVARKKSDAVDAAALANILWTDMAVHRPLSADSALVQAIAVLARAQQDAVWDRGQAPNKLRSRCASSARRSEAFAQHKQGLARQRPAPSWLPSRHRPWPRS
jgi:transposase